MHNNNLSHGIVGMSMREEDSSSRRSDRGVEDHAPTYADRFFEIKTDEVIFGTGEEKFDTYPITKIKIEKNREEHGTLYIICYKNTAGQEYKFSFYYDPANQGTIRFKNQKEMVWTKKPRSPASN